MINKIIKKVEHKSKEKNIILNTKYMINNINSFYFTNIIDPSYLKLDI